MKTKVFVRFCLLAFWDFDNLAGAILVGCFGGESHNFLCRQGLTLAWLECLANFNLSNEKRAPYCLGYIGAFSNYRVIWGLFHKPL